MILSAQTIRKFADKNLLITPFHERTVVNGKTFGLSAAGYDVRVEFKMEKIVRFSAPRWEKRQGYTFLLASTVERFVMPNNIMGIVHDKSSWARKGLTVQNTVIEPGWSGHLTLEMTYHGGGELCGGSHCRQRAPEGGHSPLHRAREPRPPERLPGRV